MIASPLYSASTDKEKQAEALLKKAQALEDTYKNTEALAAYKELTLKYGKLIDEDMGSYESIAKERIGVLQCRQRKQRRFSADTPEEIIEAIKSAKKAAQLKALMSCDFVVGQSETSNVWQANAERTSGKILNRLKEIDFKKFKRTESNNLHAFFVASSEKDDSYDSLSMEKYEERWEWNGFKTGNKKTLTQLSQTK